VSSLFWNSSASSIPNPPEKPPEPQPPEKHACAYPELLFDGNKEATQNPSWVNFEYGESPDWKERAIKCRQRDKFCCCLCGKTRSFQVHHIIPKGRLYKGSHSLQNLATLCEDCHHAQEYYDHKSLLEKARSLKI
jgi:hypothetical protein